MRTYVFTTLLAAAAALPQYGGTPDDGSSAVAVSTSVSSAAAGSYASTPTASASGKKSGCTKKDKGQSDNYPATTAAGSSSDGNSDSTPTGGASAAATTGAGKKDKKKSCSKKSKGKGKNQDKGVDGSSGSGSESSSSGSATTDAASSDPTKLPSGSSNSTSTSTGSNSTSTSSADNSAFLRGINIGNWLILEKWMDNGNAFNGKFGGASDQWSFDSIDGSQDALEKHWGSWFTEKDVEQIAGYGFNALRIPIGYWAYDNSGTPFKQGAARYLDDAIGWAGKHGMKVLVDLHGSPGSQNGQDHSGHSGAIKWQQGDNLKKSTDVLLTMAKRYGSANYSSTVWGIEMVNEPTANAPNDFGKSQSWAQDTYEKMYDALENKAVRILTHDSFRGPEKFVSIAQDLAKKKPVSAKALGGSGKSNDKRGTTFGVDQHDYQLYTDKDNSLDQKTHIRNACGWAGALKQAKAVMPTIVGEWSSLTNICAKDDGSTSPASSNQGSCTSADPSKWSKSLVEQVRRYVEAQLDVYEQNTDGYFLWSWKGPGGWGVEGPAKAGAFPSHVVNDRKYKGQCDKN